MIRVNQIVYGLLSVSLMLVSPLTNAAIEEVVVTATKREASIQKVPISVTAINAEALDRAGVSTLRDLSSLSASFNLNSAQNESQTVTMRLRGVGTSGHNAGMEGAVGVFLDGMYLSRPGVALGDLLDMEQIEVLRGPQGTLFGRNTSAGALNIRTRKPNLAEKELWTNFTFGNYNARSVQAGGNLPLVDDKLALRVSGSINKRDGWMESATSGTESNDRDRWQLRSQLLWEINENADLRLIADYAETDESCCDGIVQYDTPLVAAGIYALAGLPANGGVLVSGDAAIDRRKSNGTVKRENPVEQWGMSAELNWDLGFGRLTYLGGYREYEAGSQTEYDYSALDAMSGPGVSRGGTPAYDEYQTMSHELRLQGNTGRLDWLIGAYYMDEDIEEVFNLSQDADFARYINASTWFPALIPFTAGTGLEAVAMPLGGTYGDIINSPNPAVAYAGGVDLAGAYASNLYKQSGQSWSLFTHNTLELTEDLDLTFGLRWVNEKKEGSYSQPSASNDACLATLANSVGFPAPLVPAFAIATNCFVFAVPADLGPGLPATFADDFDDDELVYTLKLTYDLSDAIMTYASFSHGYKAGGFNLDSTAAINGADPRFDAEIVDAWEVGLKSYLFNSSLRANLALYRMEMEDFQSLEFTGIQLTTFNIPKVESQGVELELLALPTDGLQLGLSLAYTDASFPSDCDGNDPNAAPSIAALCGYPLQNAPEWVGILTADYEGRFSDSGLTYFLHADVRWEDDRRSETQAVEVSTGVPLIGAIQDAHSKANLRAGIGSADGRWTLEAWGVNVTDESTHNYSWSIALRGFGSLGQAARGAFLEPPRMYGLTLRTVF